MKFSSSSFDNQVVVVTGGTRGLGRAISEAFLARGARVHATYRSNDREADAFKDANASAGDRLMLHGFDVADYDEVESFWKRLDECVPDGVQVLVNNAGLRRDGVLAMMAPEDWNQVLATNLGGCYHMSKFAVLNMVRQRYGRILMITSPAGSFGFQGQGNYCASKAGQVGLMRALAKEVARRKITVNCISPGFIDTDLIADLPEALRAEYTASVPMRRFGQPSDVAYAALCLAAPEASYITGTTLEVTGGL
ncbi:MAG: SDR family NAD(P)-dependent oxidoreductase [bacterium]|jgi:3-oxoacyl-[acyl-carrier protein] reductase|nr:SDR family oxidoreductase [Planctomycetota bacterium]HIL52035.1 SDR family oxidoreductase [Planctomycetota bacterium]